MRFARALATTVLTLGLVAAGDPAAEAVPYVSTCQFGSGSFSAKQVVVGTTGVATVNVTIRATNCQNETPRLELHDNNSAWLWGDLRPSEADPTLLQDTIEIDPARLSNSAAGVPLSGTIYIGSTSYPFGAATFTLKREVWMLDQYAPSKVKKNKSFSVYGILDVADWDLGLDIGLSKTKVQLQSSVSGGHYTTLKTATSRTGQQGGSVEAKVKIKKATCFRWIYAGSSTNAALTSDGDCVKIKK